MSISSDLLNEMSLEAEVTRKYLALVPFEKASFKPAEKSEELGRLAIHIAEITAWWTSCVKSDRLDFMDFNPKEIESTQDLLHYFDELLEEAKQALSETSDDEFDNEWSMTYGEEVLFTLPKKQVARIFCMNHLVHHRAQLGVYLRILGIPLPAIYGPSADDEDVLLIKKIF